MKAEKSAEFVLVNYTEKKGLYRNKIQEYYTFQYKFLFSKKINAYIID